MKNLTNKEINRLSPCDFDSAVGVADQMFKYYHAAEGAQWARESEERTAFLEFYNRLNIIRKERGL